MRRIMFLSAGLLCALSVRGQHSRPEDSRLLDKPIEAAVRTIGKGSLKDMLWMGAAHMRSDYMTFGIEFAGDEAVQPRVLGDVAAGTHVRDFLAGIFRQVPQYDYEVISSHLVSIYPTGAKDDTKDPLNLAVARFDIENAKAGNVLAFPVQFIPELRAALYPETSQHPRVFVYAGSVVPGPAVTVHLTNVTVREILNAVSIATESATGDDYPLGWTYRSAASLAEKGPRFGVFVSLPQDWKDAVHPKQEPMGRH